MERRNFFKSLFAAGMVVAAPRILTDNVEAIEITKLPPDFDIKEFKKEFDEYNNKVVKSTPQIYKGSIKHKGKVIANFNEVTIAMERSFLDASYLYDENGYFNPTHKKIPQSQSSIITLYAMNINWDLSNAAFYSDDLVEICVTTETEGEIHACGYITQMQVNSDFMEPICNIWEINISGEIITTIKKGES